MTGGINLHNFFSFFLALINHLIQFSINPLFILIFQIVYFSLGFLVLLGIIILFRRNIALSKKIFDYNKLSLGNIASGEVKDNPRWEKIKNLLASESSADWKIAILEADKILDEMTIRMGSQGESLGERLKQIEASDFLTLDDAWQAHKVRNDIAHSPDFSLSQRKAKEALKKYENVFKEFHFISPRESLE